MFDYKQKCHTQSPLGLKYAVLFGGITYIVVEFQLAYWRNLTLCPATMLTNIKNERFNLKLFIDE